MKKDKSKKIFGGIKLTKNNMGFYIALAICIVTVAAAAWTTYGSLLQDQSDISDSAEGSEVQTAEDVSGESYEKSIPEDVGVTDGISELSSSNGRSEESEALREESESPDNDADETFFPVEETSVMKDFSVSKLVFSKTTTDWRIHGGVDFHANRGTAVRAISKGVIKSVYKDPMYGNVIEIDHDGFGAKYCGLTDNCPVSEGDHVEAGSTIGYVGVVPCELLDGDHIHLETTVNGTPVDPVSIIEKHHK